MEFRWNAANEQHIASHNISAEEAEYVVNRSSRPYPTYEGDGKFLVRGQTESGNYLQVIYIFDPNDVVYVIHARLLTDREKRNLRKRRR